MPRVMIVCPVTEQLVPDDIDSAAECLRAAADAGPEAAIDHFGTGSPSLSHVHALPTAV